MNEFKECLLRETVIGIWEPVLEWILAQESDIRAAWKLYNATRSIHIGSAELSGDHMYYFCFVHAIFPNTGIEDHSGLWYLSAGLLTIDVESGAHPAPTCQDLVNIEMHQKMIKRQKAFHWSVGWYWHNTK